MSARYGFSWQGHAPPCAAVGAAVMPGVTATIRDRQFGCLSQSTTVEAKSVEGWPFRARLVNNVIGMASPVL